MSMTYAVATHGRLLACNEQGEGVELSSGYHYGLSVDGDAQRLRAIRCGDTVDSRGEVEILTFDCSTLELESRTPLGPWFDAVHQLANSGNGRLAAVNTHRNAVVLFDDDLIEIGRHHIDGRYRDINHVNSAFWLDGGLVVNLHNFGRKPSELVVLGLEDHTITEVGRIPLLDTMCHNIYADSNEAVYNASPSRSLRKISFADGSVRSLDLGEHAKGLSVSADRLVVGASDFSERSMRARANGALVTIDRETFRESGRIPVTVNGTSSGNINEIRRIDGTELSESNTELTVDEFLRLSPETPLAERLRQQPQLIARRAQRNKRDLQDTLSQFKSAVGARKATP